MEVIRERESEREKVGGVNLFLYIHRIWGLREWVDKYVWTKWLGFEHKNLITLIISHFRGSDFEEALSSYLVGPWCLPTRARRVEPTSLTCSFKVILILTPFSSCPPPSTSDFSSTAAAPSLSSSSLHKSIIFL